MLEELLLDRVVCRGVTGTEIRLADKASGPCGQRQLLQRPSSSPLLLLLLLLLLAGLLPPLSPYLEPASLRPVPQRTSPRSEQRAPSSPTWAHLTLYWPASQRKEQGPWKGKREKVQLLLVLNPGGSAHKHCWQHGLPDTGLPAVLEPVQQLHEQLLEPDDNPASRLDVHAPVHMDALLGLGVALNHCVGAFVASLVTFVQPVRVDLSDFQA